ncbi:MAG: hypothetical protein Q4A65_07610 [Bacillota bacterium]|nr:hypothetical protein [Bacillota bacterium]
MICADACNNKAIVADTKPAEAAGKTLSKPKISVKNIATPKKGRAKLMINMDKLPSGNINEIKVYRSNSGKGKFKQIKILTGDTSSWINVKLKKKRSYFYKIKVFGTTSDGKKIYSPLSNKKKGERDNKR